ncbi:MAG TPA: hypothetical protein VNM14_01425 [Planctomycetota bacterium]|jgi:hypothetical protein|nr:hypothetical protein [Planctomycetota bacterium]
MAADEEDEDSLLMRIVSNELLWVVIAALGILGLAFHLATK